MVTRRVMKHKVKDYGSQFQLPRLASRVCELRDLLLRSSFCSTGSTRVAHEKSSPGSKRRVVWDPYEYVVTISRTPTLESCASLEPEESATIAVLLYRRLLYLGGDALSVEAESKLRLRAANPGPPLHPRVHALRGSESPRPPRPCIREFKPSASLDSCALAEQEEMGISVEILYLGGDALSVEAESKFYLRAANAGPQEMSLDEEG